MISYVTIFITGKGVVYSFDPVGSYGSDGYRARGSAAAMLQPLLDNQVQSLFNPQHFSLNAKLAHSLICSKGSCLVLDYIGGILVKASYKSGFSI